MDLEKFKKQYGALEKKYRLPKFAELNEEFEIERIGRESDTLLRTVRKSMIDRMVWYVGFLESLLSPANQSPMVMALMKEVGIEERKVFWEAYKSLIEVEIRNFSLEINYSEKGEAESIKDILKRWKALKKDLESVFRVLERNWHSSSSKREKSYFG